MQVGDGRTCSGASALIPHPALVPPVMRCCLRRRPLKLGSGWRRLNWVGRRPASTSSPVRTFSATRPEIGPAGGRCAEDRRLRRPGRRTTSTRPRLVAKYEGGVREGAIEPVDYVLTGLRLTDTIDERFDWTVGLTSSSRPRVW